MSTDDQARPLSAGDIDDIHTDIWLHELEMRAATCTTHHSACDCRRWHDLMAVADLRQRLDAAQARVGVLEAELIAVRDHRDRVYDKMATLWQFAVGVARSVTRDQVDDVYARLPLAMRERLLAEAREGENER